MEIRLRTVDTKPEPVFVHRDRSTVIGKTVHFNRRDTALTDTQNKTAFVIDTAGPWTYNLPKTDAEKIKKYENFTLEIKNHLEA
jgi:hypothetical protein